MEIQSLTTAPPTVPAVVRLQDRRLLGPSIWLLLLLQQWFQEGRLTPESSVRVTTLATALSMGERQVRRDLQRLQRAGYLQLHNTGRGFSIRLTS